MKKPLTTLVAFVALLFGALAFVAPITSAAATCSTENPGTTEDPCEPRPCTTENPGSTEDPCTPVELEDPCAPSAAATESVATEGGPAPVAADARADRLQAVADRRAKTIQRLRAKIRELR